MMRKVLLIIALICLTPYLGMSADLQAQKPLARTKIVKPNSSLPMETPKPGVERQDIRAQLLPVNYTTIAAEIGAKVDHFYFREGESFSKGKTLISFECASQRAQLNKARAAMAIAEKTYKTNARLLELNSVGRLEYEASEADYQKSVAEVDVLSSQLSKCRIQAPFRGTVVEQKVREDQYVQAGQPLLEILDDSILELEFIVPSKWMAWLKSGYKFQIKIDETGAEYPARMTRVGARIDTISQSLKVAGVIDGKFPELRAGMSGLVIISPPDGLGK